MSAAGGLRMYELDELGSDGYPLEWHRTIKHLVREQAGHRCIRCGHPYRVGAHQSGEWTRCDVCCKHYGPTRQLEGLAPWGIPLEAQWRILTVHHLNRDKADCRWWNLTALCQRCHLSIQGKVYLEREFIREHSDWFKPYAAGWYAFRYLGEELSCEETMARLDELLAFEFRQPALFTSAPAAGGGNHEQR